VANKEMKVVTATAMIKTTTTMQIAIHTRPDSRYYLLAIIQPAILVTSMHSGI
jgi:hypothetical protein